MKHFLTLQWRILLAYTALIVVSIGVVIVSPMAWITVLAGLAIAVLSIGLGYVLAMRASRSVRSITEAARRIGAGDLDYRAKLDVDDENAELAAAFNRMAETLRQTIRDLSSERAKLATVVNTMADGVVVTDAQGDVVLTNQAAETMLRPRPLVRHQTRLMDLLRDHELQSLVESSKESASIRHSEVEMVGPYRLISAIATPLPINGARGTLLTLHDLTSTRQLDTTRREFVTNVSHELRSPIASLIALVETLENGALDDRNIAVDFIGRIHDEANRMGAIVEELLELSRLESGQAPLRLVPLSLSVMVTDITGEFRLRAERSGVDLDTSLPDSLPHALADETTFRRALVNLVDNAIKFTPVGGQVHMSVAEEEDTIRVEVRDTGEGIPREHLPHIFERFYKVDRSRRDKGTGLGLAIVKHTVEAHGGRVHAESEEGEGSVFSVSVPRAT